MNASTWSPRTRQRVLSASALVGFFLLWELACIASGVSDLILPRPSQIAPVLWVKMPLLWPHALQTLNTTLAGFALGVVIGILLGLLIGSSRTAMRSPNFFGCKVPMSASQPMNRADTSVAALIACIGVMPRATMIGNCRALRPCG